MNGTDVTLSRDGVALKGVEAVRVNRASDNAYLTL